MKFLIAFLSLLAGGCATLRSNAVIPLDFSSQPPRAAIRGFCNDESFTTQGTVVCEEKAPREARISVKVPPLEGRVVYSNGQLKRTDDFNWYPKEGFWLWKKKPIKDTWLDLDLGEIAATFGAWPVALDIIAVSNVGIVNTRGILFHRICNDQDIPCSRLVVEYECAGYHKATGENRIGKCERLSGSPQAFAVQVGKAPRGAKLLVAARRLGVKWMLDVTDAERGSGFKKFELPPIGNGPTLVDMELVWWEGDALKSERTTVLLVGFDPEWTGMDRPHYLDKKDKVEWVKPVLADLMEVDLYEGTEIREKKFGGDKVVPGSRPDKAGRISCAFAWQRDSSDLSVQCLNDQLQEVRVP